VLRLIDFNHATVPPMKALTTTVPKADPSHHPSSRRQHSEHHSMQRAHMSHSGSYCARQTQWDPSQPPGPSHSNDMHFLKIFKKVVHVQ
jgi:hypothetical protein